MVRANNPLIPLSSRGHGGLGAALEAGREDKRRGELFEMAKTDRDRQIQLEDEDRAAAAAQMQAKEEEARMKKNLQSIAIGAVQVKPMLDNIETIPQAVSTLQRRIQEIEARGGDASDSKEALEAIQAGRIDQARIMVDSAIQAGAAQGIIKVAPDGTMTIPAELQTFNAMTKGLPEEDVNKARRVNLGIEARAGSTSAQERIATDPNLTSQVAGSQAQIKGETVEAQEREKRNAGLIQQGVEVADSMPTLKRTFELLKAVETGGKAAEVQLAAKRLFGIESADEGELSGMLGKAVLSQLRETFGAQFTEQEGQRLENIEANFGKNNATNMRLISNAMQIVERKAKRAIRLAESREDFETADMIQDALDSTLEPQTDDFQAQWDAAPSGTVLQAPDGTLRRKP